MYVYDIRGHRLWGVDRVQREENNKGIREIIMFPLHTQSRCNTHMYIYNMVTEVKLFGGRKEPRGGEGGYELSQYFDIE